jgi:hypothetical protein
LKQKTVELLIPDTIVISSRLPLPMLLTNWAKHDYQQ